MTERKDKVVAQLCRGIQQLLTANGVKQFTGAAAFKDRNTIAIAGETLIGAKKTIIATGSMSATPDFVPKHQRVVDSKSFLALSRLPKTSSCSGAATSAVKSPPWRRCSASRSPSSSCSTIF